MKKTDYYEKLLGYCERANMPLLVYQSNSLPNPQSLKNEILNLVGALPKAFESDIPQSSIVSYKARQQDKDKLQKK